MVIDGSNPSEKNGDPNKKDWFDSRCLTIFKVHDIKQRVDDGNTYTIHAGVISRHSRLLYAQVMELVDMLVLETNAFSVRVRVPL